MKQELKNVNKELQQECWWCARHSEGWGEEMLQGNASIDSEYTRGHSTPVWRNCNHQRVEQSVSHGTDSGFRDDIHTRNATLCFPTPVHKLEMCFVDKRIQQVYRAHLKSQKNGETAVRSRRGPPGKLSFSKRPIQFFGTTYIPNIVNDLRNLKLVEGDLISRLQELAAEMIQKMTWCSSGQKNRTTTKLFDVFAVLVEMILFN